MNKPSIETLENTIRTSIRNHPVRLWCKFRRGTEGKVFLYPKVRCPLHTRRFRSFLQAQKGKLTHMGWNLIPLKNGSYTLIPT